MTLETETGRQEPQVETNPAAVWKSQIEKLKKASTGTPEERLNAGLELQIISLGMSVWFQEKDWPTPLEEFREKEPAESVQKQPPKNWFSRFGF